MPHLPASLSVFRAAFLTVAIGVAAGCQHAPQSSPAASPGASEEGAAEEVRPRRAVGVGRSVDGEDLKSTRVARAEELLKGRFAGVQVFYHPGGISVRIRGTTSLTGSNEPLYVVDGMPVSPAPGGALLGINPYDIERIEVLKDIGSTAFYGVRGANGVVLITTRRPR